MKSTVCSVRSGKDRLRKHGENELFFFRMSVYVQTDGNQELLKDEFFRILQVLISKAPQSNLLMIPGDLIARVRRISPLGGLLGVHSCRNEIRDRLLQFCTDNHIFLSRS